MLVKTKKGFKNNFNVCNDKCRAFFVILRWCPLNPSSRQVAPDKTRVHPGFYKGLASYYRKILLSKNKQKNLTRNLMCAFCRWSIRRFPIFNEFPAKEGGDLLIFLNGVKEINMVVNAAVKYAESNKQWIVMPLHSNLSLDEQDKVLTPFYRFLIILPMGFGSVLYPQISRKLL